MSRRAARLRPWAVAAWGAVLAAGAGAQQLTLAPPVVLDCLTPPPEQRGLPEYPPEALARRDGGTVNVELRFDAPDQAPSVRVLEPHAFQSLEDAVEQHVRSWRVPCHPIGAAPARLQFSFVFRPESDGRRVSVTPPRDAAAVQRRQQLACMERVDKRRRPDYPTRARQADEQGNYLVRMRFVAPDQAPEVQLLGGSRSRSLRAEVEDFAAGFRVPCLGGAPLETDLLFSFRLDGGRRTYLNDMALKPWVLSARDLPRPAHFELDTMACPFDLQVTYRQPFARNIVRQLGDADARRLGLIDWIERTTLDLPNALQTEALGSTFKLQVPCGSVDL